MSIRKCTPCDCDGICPYDAQYGHDCEYWCGADEPEDYPEFDEDDEYNDYIETVNSVWRETRGLVVRP